MGLFDSFKRKHAGFIRTRNVEMEFAYECPQCFREKTMCLEIPLVEDDKHIYTQWAGQSSIPNLTKLPIVSISLDEQKNCVVEDIFDNLGDGKSAPISSERWKEIELVIECPYCGGKAHFVLAVGIIHNTEGGILLQKDRNIPEVHALPIVLLSNVGQGNFNVVTFLNPTLEPTKDTETVELDLESAEDYNKRGADYYLKQQYNLAIADFTRAIELDPSFSGAYHNRGLAFRDDGQYALALLDFNKAIELNPGAIDYFNRGLAYSDTGLYDLSITDFSKAIELDRDFARAYYERSCAYYNKGSYDLSLADLNRVIEISTDDNLTELARQAITNLKDK